MDVDGITRWFSSHGMDATMQRLRQAIQEQGMTVFAQIDHGRAAADAGLAPDPMQLLMFGSALAGVKLMQAAPTTGIDLPLKILVWVDQEGGTWLGYNEPGWIAARHFARAGNDQVLTAMRRALSAIAEQVTSP